MMRLTMSSRACEHSMGNCKFNASSWLICYRQDRNPGPRLSKSKPENSVLATASLTNMTLVINPV
eukprot:1651140-Karenia_brevis.AAC.1